MEGAGGDEAEGAAVGVAVVVVSLFGDGQLRSVA
jgi:hypothetical protein